MQVYTYISYNNFSMTSVNSSKSLSRKVTLFCIPLKTHHKFLSEIFLMWSSKKTAIKIRGMNCIMLDATSAFVLTFVPWLTTQALLPRYCIYAMFVRVQKGGNWAIKQHVPNKWECSSWKHNWHDRMLHWHCFMMVTLFWVTWVWLSCLLLMTSENVN